MYLTAETTGHMVWTHSLFADLVYAFRFNIIRVFTLVVLEVPAAYAAPGICCPPDKRGAKGTLGLVYLCACDLFNEALVEFKGLNRVGYLYVH